MIPDLFLLGGVDLAAGLLLLGMRPPVYKMLTYTLTPDVVLLLAIAVILKGAYTIAWGFRGS